MSWPGRARDAAPGSPAGDHRIGPAPDQGGPKRPGASIAQASNRYWTPWPPRASSPCRGRPRAEAPTRRTPIVAGGQPASELIIAEQRRGAMNEPAGPAATSYLDSDTLVKRYLVETGTPWVQTWCADPTPTVAVGEIGLVEIATAFAGKLRGRAHHLGPIPQRPRRLGGVSRRVCPGHDQPGGRGQGDRVDRKVSSAGIQDAVHLACALNLNRALVAYRLPCPWCSSRRMTIS